MNFDQILELIKVVSASELTVFQYEEGNQKITMQAGEVLVNTMNADDTAPNTSVVKVQESIHTQTATTQTVEVQKTTSEGNDVTSPLVGRFYAAPSEDAEPFVKVGDSVKKGQVLAIVEAMKLMNEIESDYDGIVTEILAENGQGVEYGQPLFRITA